MNHRARADLVNNQLRAMKPLTISVLWDFIAVRWNDGTYSVERDKISIGADRLSRWKAVARIVDNEHPARELFS